jgi:16S rRNA processing protein RimM
LVDPISEQLLALRRGAEVRLGPDHTRKIFLELDGVDSREAAELMRGQEIALPLEDVPPLPQDTYYRWQIIGLRVLSEDGEELGTISEILETGANDVYIVRDPAGQELLLPAIESVILEVDLEAGVVRVHLIPGLRG